MSLRPSSWRGPPLALQIVALLLGGLIVAQLVTLLLTLLLPPTPVPQYELGDIAAALSDRRGEAHRGLERIIQSGPPDISGSGWLTSERSRHQLARLIGVDERRVALAFYTPLPFAGTTAARNYAMANDGRAATLTGLTGKEGSAATLVLAQFNPSAGTLAPSPMQGQRLMPPPRDSFPPGLYPGTGRPGEARGRASASGPELPPTERWGAQPLISIDPRFAAPRGGVFVPGDGGVAVPPLLRGEDAGAMSVRPASPTMEDPTAALSANAITKQQVGAAQHVFTPPFGLSPPPQGSGTPPLQDGFPAAVPMTRFALPNRNMLLPHPRPMIEASPTSRALISPDTPPPAAHVPSMLVPRAIAPNPDGVIITPITPVPPMLRTPAPSDPVPEYSEPPSGPPIAINAPGRSLFGLAPAPFVEGDFVAALRMQDGRWSVVQPVDSPFPNSWQRRVLLWFAISLGLVAPFGWLFARRLVKPLDRFARAAEQLGRDPAVAIGPLDGPAEIGRAAHAFNLMQGRLRAFVDDRTAMVGAISHDLRTPLTRMRFRIEDVPDNDVRDGLLEEVEAMEAMIAQVIDYIRDASMPGARERLDLATLVEEAAADARMIGGQVVIEHSDPAPVEVDVLGVRRVLDNLLENAIKYGDRARIRLRTEAGSAIAEIIDEGPGLPDDEMERAFEPFYRSVAARSSPKSGSGLGLAVCRSIARAHGGDVQLRQTKDGFLAEMRVPLAFDADRPANA